MLHTPVVQTPEIVLVRWRLLKDNFGYVHALGWNVMELAGRVSSAVEQLDIVALRLVTNSGRVYQLQGPPGQDPDALYVWESWCTFLGVVHWTDVTHEVISTSEQPAPGPTYAARQ